MSVGGKRCVVHERVRAYVSVSHARLHFHFSRAVSISTHRSAVIVLTRVRHVAVEQQANERVQYRVTELTSVLRQ